MPIKTSTFYIPKMDCPTEEALIKQRLQAVTGIEQLTFNLIQKELTVRHTLADDTAIVNVLTGLGMAPQQTGVIAIASNEASQLPSESALSRRAWLLLAVAGIAALAAEILAVSLAQEKSPIVLALALLAMVLSGRQTLLKGLRAIRHFTLNINFLMVIAITGAFIIGEWPEAAMVTVLFALAEMIEGYSLDKARHAISKLMEMAPEVATVQENGSWRVKPVADISIDTIIWVKPGERIPLDGVIIKGQTSINQAPITGESMPVDKKVGDTVFAGTINEQGSFEVKVTANPGDSLLAKITRAVQQAQSERAPTQRFVDQFAKYYTPTMVLFAVLVALVPPLLFNAAFYPWLYKALVLLVIACPCALVISTPVTVVSGLAAAAKQGILIKGGAYLEVGHKLKAIALDKTGTLTYGKPLLTDIIPLASLSEAEVLRLAASLDSHSEHPVAHAIVAYWQRLNPSGTLLSVSDFKAIPGRGVVGTIGEQPYFLGNHRLAEEKSVCNAEVESQLKRLEQAGKTTVILGTAQTALAILAVADTVRETSQQAIQTLHQLGVTTIMLTGDNPTTAQAIAQAVGMDDIRANLLPDDKLTAINELLQRYHQVGMVGDGINDAPALAKATIGFAMGAAGTDTALETADVALMEDNLTKLPTFIQLSRRTARALTQNISLSIGIKGIFFFLALFGVATLWMAVFADMGASLLVVFNGLQLLRFNNNLPA